MTDIEKTLALEEIDVPNLYRSKQLWKPIGARGVFGGQVIGLALNAAIRTVDATFQVHSLHCYFLMAGDNSTQIVYKVDELRTGKTYATRCVTATQRGRNIFTAIISFALPEISQLSYQEAMPVVPHPDQLKSDVDRLKSLLEEPRAKMFHESIKMRLAQPLIIERKIVPSKHFQSVAGTQPNKIMMWMKADGSASGLTRVGTLPDTLAVHQCVAAYCSDFELLNAALVPFGLHRMGERRMQAIKMMASLDHAIWFHEAFRADEWLLYEIEAGKTKAGRGFANGRIWSMDGRLVISTAQEGVIRAELGDGTLPTAKM
ncbi:Acyl-CoA thioesterase 8 [Kappamyces sp. JEL0680]|nr:Acyl-CoA thioesterase 8 [Kappamyces sp. JEL0680]